MRQGQRRQRDAERELGLSSGLILAFLRGGDDKEMASGSPAASGPAYRFTGYRKFLDPDGYPAVAPPWGTLSAIDLNSGTYLWRIPLGEYPALADKTTGSENYGGPILTRGGALFIAAIAILPNIVLWIGNTRSFPFGGTTVLIAVGVALEVMRQIDSQLMLRNYEGFLK